MPESTSRWWYLGTNVYVIVHRHPFIVHRHPFIVHVRLGRAALITRRWHMRLHW